jgi:hypothetical protein
LIAYEPDETLLLRYLDASPTLRIIELLDNPLSDYSKNEIANNLAMSRVTFKYWKELETSGAVKTTGTSDEPRCTSSTGPTTS